MVSYVEFEIYRAWIDRWLLLVKARGLVFVMPASGIECEYEKAVFKVLEQPAG
jgi:hypothetical protein